MAVVACSGALSAAIDLRTRRVPNEVTLGTAVAGLVLAAVGLSGVTLGASLAALVLGFVLMLPGHLIGATGAGDVKLFAALATLLGPAGAVTAFFYTAIAGGVLAVVVAIRRRRLVETMGGVAALVSSAGGRRTDIEAPSRNNRFAYAPAIAVGALLAAAGA